MSVTKDGVETITQKYVEGTKVGVPQWLGVSDIRKWIHLLIDKCAQCSGRADNLEQKWILEVFKNGEEKEREYYATSWRRERRHASRAQIPKA